jgi:ABC-type amino acid transport substrate-binding protein
VGRLIRIVILSSAVLLILAVITGCSPDDRSAAPDSEDAGGSFMTPGGESAAPPAESPGIQWNGEELGRIAELQASGLTIAMTESDAIWELNENGDNIGVQYLLADAFAETIGAELTVRMVDFLDYFSIGGQIPDQVKSDESFSYRPDLLDDGIDMYVDTITVLPWRERILTLVPVFPTRLVVLSKTSEPVNTLDDLLEARISIIPGTASEDVLRGIERERGVRLEIIFVEEVQEEARLVAEGLSDATV